MPYKAFEARERLLCLVRLERTMVNSLMGCTSFHLPYAHLSAAASAKYLV